MKWWIRASRHEQIKINNISANIGVIGLKTNAIAVPAAGGCSKLKIAIKKKATPAESDKNTMKISLW